MCGAAQQQTVGSITQQSALSRNKTTRVSLQQSEVLHNHRLFTKFLFRLEPWNTNVGHGDSMRSST